MGAVLAWCWRLLQSAILAAQPVFEEPVASRADSHAAGKVRLRWSVVRGNPDSHVRRPAALNVSRSQVWHIYF